MRRLTLDFLAAGRAEFTIDTDGGDYFSYRVVLREFNHGHDVVILAFQKTHHEPYIGRVLMETGRLRLTDKSTFDGGEPVVKVLRRAIQCAFKGEPLPQGWSIEHHGVCARCGQPLTTPESIKRGLGPVCADELNRRKAKTKSRHSREWLNHRNGADEKRARRWCSPSRESSEKAPCVGQQGEVFS
jgi:hypothetical protein